jgi:hydrogenase expression/formation protein HypC
MCLAVPGKVVSIDGQGLLPMAKVSFGGVNKDVCLAYVPEVVVGDYVIVHAGFAISQLDETEAMEVFKVLREMGELDELPDTAGTSGAAAPAV